MEVNNQKGFKITEDLLVKIHKRFLNFFIDSIAISVLLFIGLTIYIANTSPTMGKEFMGRFLTNNILQYTITSTFTLLYYNFLEIITATTIGKYFTNTIVVDQYGNKAGHEAVMIRSLIRIIPMYWISFLFFPKRGLHDAISKTYVVNKRLLEEKKNEFHQIQK